MNWSELMMNSNPKENDNAHELNEIIDNAHSMSQTKINESLFFLFDVMNKQLNQSLENTRRALEASEHYQSETLDLMKQIEDYENFVRDARLEKQFLFHSRKGVI